MAERIVMPSNDHHDNDHLMMIRRIQSISRRAKTLPTYQLILYLIRVWLGQVHTRMLILSMTEVSGGNSMQVKQLNSLLDSPFLSS